LRDAVLVIAFAAVCLFTPLVLALSPRDGEAVAVFAAPWTGAGAPLIVAAADGRLLDATANHLLAIAIDPSPGFAARLYAAGAVLVIDAEAAALCLGRSPDQPTANGTI
jgi:hypothetical protein